MALEYDDQNPVELCSGVYHLGVFDDVNAWANIPYLVTSGGRGALIDPGSARPDFVEVVRRKIAKVMDPRDIELLIVQHQDPDLCAALPLFEPEVSPDAQIVCPLESALLVQHYGCSLPILKVEDDGVVTFGDGRELTFLMTPYAHFVGSMVTYDEATKTVFSSDAFGGFTIGSEVYAGPGYKDLLATFLTQYLGSKRALEYALRRLGQVAEATGIERICPQHGCVIDAPQIGAYLEAAEALPVGSEVDRLAEKHGITLSWSEQKAGAA